MRIDDRLKKIELQILNYLKMVTKSYKLLKKSLTENNVEILDEIMANDKKIDTEYYAIFDNCVWLINRENPIARDLRKLIALLFISRELERVADASKYVSKQITKYSDTYEPKKYKTWLNKLIIGIINQLDLLEKDFVEYSATKALTIAENDNDINKEYKAMIIKTMEISKNKDKKEDAKFLTTVTTSLKSLEKGADHIVSLTEEIFYIDKGYHYE